MEFRAPRFAHRRNVVTKMGPWGSGAHFRLAVGHVGRLVEALRAVRAVAYLGQLPARDPLILVACRDLAAAVADDRDLREPRGVAVVGVDAHDGLARRER